RAASSAYGAAGAGATYGAPRSGPWVASRSAALSRTLRVRACSTAMPCHPSPTYGPIGFRPRVGLSPKTPQHEAGMRIDPPPSPPCAMGTIPDATAAAEPPLDPPGVYAVFQGLRVGPYSRGSVTGKMPISEVLVFPTINSPADLSRRTSSLSPCWTNPWKNRHALVVQVPASTASMSLSRNGTPRNGPSGSGPRACC